MTNYYCYVLLNDGLRKGYMRSFRPDFKSMTKGRPNDLRFFYGQIQLRKTGTFWHLVVLRKCSFIVTGIPLFQSLTPGIFGPLNPTLLGRVLSGSQQFDSMTKSYLPIGGRYLPSWKGMSHGTWTRNRAAIIPLHTEVWQPTWSYERNESHWLGALLGLFVFLLN